MEASVLHWLGLAALCPILMLAPGGWIAFTLFDSRLAYPLRLAMAIAFSPFVVGLQVLVATTLGLSFNTAALLTLLNVAALALMRPPRPGSATVATPNLWALLGCVAALGGWLVAGWLVEPGLRIYAWHNMMQAAPLYEITRLPDPIEEWDLAGFGVQYPWVGHIQIAVIAKLANLSPFYVHPITNVLSLYPTLALLGAGVLRFRPKEPIGAVVAATVAFLTTNLLGVILAYLKGVPAEGELRLCTILYKYINFDIMTYGIALTAGAILTLIVARQEPSGYLRWLIGAAACAAAVAVIYPLMFPVLFLLIGASAAAPKLNALLQGRRITLVREDAYAAAALVGTFAVFWINTALLTSGNATALVHFETIPGVLQSVKHAIKAVGLWAPFLVLAALRAPRDADAARTMLLMTAGAAVGAFLLLVLPSQDQYKFMYVGLMAMMPLVADEALGLFRRLPRVAAWAVSGATAVVVGLVALHIVRDHWPWFGVVNSPALREDRFVVEPTAPELAWTIAVRDRSPPDTVIVYPPTLMPHSVFAQRASYMPVDVGYPYRYGHLIRVDETLRDIKGLPADVIEARTRLVSSLYAPGAEMNYARAVDELGRLGRPVAVVGAPDAGVIAWLKANGPGRSFYQDDQTLVWLITTGEDGE